MTAITVQSRADRSRWLRSGSGHIFVVAAAVACWLASAVLDRSTLDELTAVFLLAAIGCSWNLVGGFGGQFSLGHSVFVGTAGYTTAILLRETEMALPVVIILAAALATVTGVVMALPMMRLSGAYFAIGTLGIALAALGWMLNWDYTGASAGYAIPVEDLRSVDEVYKLALVVLTVTLSSSLLFVRSSLGLRLQALRDDEAGAASLGVVRVRVLSTVWAVSAFIAGLAGAVIAVRRGALEPNSAFSLFFTLDAVVVTVIGGLGRLSGPVAGAVVVHLIREYATDQAEWAALIEAFVLVLVLWAAPRGVLGSVEQGLRRIRNRFALVRGPTLPEGG